MKRGFLVPACCLRALPARLCCLCFSRGLLCLCLLLQLMHRITFAQRSGRVLDTTRVDAAWDPLGFLVPALAQALMVWSHLG